MDAISKHMTTKLITVNEKAFLQEAYLLMSENSIRHLPVTNKDGIIVGVISDRDLQRALHSSLSFERGLHKEELTFMPEDCVEDYMSTPVKFFDRKTPVDHVVREMIKDKISCYLILDSTRVVGIVTSEDFLQFLLQLLTKSEASQWSLDDLLTNPDLQATGHYLGQIGI